MLPTAGVLTSVVIDSGALDAFLPDSVWAQMGTIGVAATLEIARHVEKQRADVLFVDAPVSGSKGPAETGELPSSPRARESAAAKLRRPFEAIGRKTVWVGDAGQGTRLKLAVNAYLSILIEGVAETLELSSRLGVETTDLAEAIEGGPLDAPLADAKLHKMLRGDFTPEFPLEWALKDVDLAIGEAGDDVLPLLRSLSTQWRGAVESGHGREDVSAVRLGLHES